jgi:hypothetical protein
MKKPGPNRNHRGEMWERLLRLSVCDPVTGCWIWIGAYVINLRGDRYGKIWDADKGRTVLAHRAAWACVHGYEMPKRKHGAHSCDNTLCICPDHVRGARPGANQREAYRKGRRIPTTGANNRKEMPC